MDGQEQVPVALRPEKARVLATLEAGWDPRMVCIGAENLASLGFEHRTVQPVAIRYTAWAPSVPRNKEKG